MTKSRAIRRHEAKKKQEKRVKYLSSVSGSAAVSKKLSGRCKDTHPGCGCQRCKPWKHGKEPSLKPSERRKLQGEEE